MPTGRPGRGRRAFVRRRGGAESGCARPDLVAALVLLDPAVGLDGGWMLGIANDMFASADYTNRAEARSEKATGSWADVEPDVLDRELDEHLIDVPGGRWDGGSAFPR